MEKTCLTLRNMLSLIRPGRTARRIVRPVGVLPVLIVLALAVCAPGNAGAVDWAANFGTSGGNAMIRSTAVDGSGNRYIAGSFTGATISFGSETLTRIGTRDAFAAKLDASGTVLWAKNFGGSGASAYGTGIAVDGSGNVYLGGYFDGASLTTPVLPWQGIWDSFALKLDSAGTTTWSKSFGGSGAAVLAQGIAVDGSGNVYLGGYMQGAGLTTPALTLHGNVDAVAFKLDSSGTTAWARNFGGSGASAYGRGIAVDGSGYVYLGGYFAGANLTTPALTRIGAQDAFALKLDSDGATSWQKNFGGSEATASSFGIAVDGSGNVYLGGHFSGASLTTPALTRIGTQDAFALKLDGGGATSWANNFGGSGASAFGFGIAVTGGGIACLAGHFTGANLTAPALTSIGAQDAFALMLDAGGATTWANNFGGSGASAYAYGIAVGGSDVSLGGYFAGANLTTPALTRIGVQDALLISNYRLADNGNGTVADRFTGLNWQQGEGGRYSWSDALTYCENLTLAGASDWRLPDINELQSLLNTDYSFFPGMFLWEYWSSSTYAYGSGYAWFVDFNSGYVSYYFKTYTYYVRCVRVGQFGPLYTLTLLKTGAGSGTVSSSPAGISCGATCAADFARDTEVTLSATPATGSTFAGWSGACTGAGACSVTMNAAKSVTATFETIYTVTATATGNGAGAVGSSTGGIDYSYPIVDAGTTAAMAPGTAVTLTATAAAGSTVSWTTCTGTVAGNGTTTATCAYTSLDGDKTAQATFTLDTYTVTFDLAGGTRSGGGELTQTIGHGQVATAPTLTAPAEMTFVGWDKVFTNITSAITVTARYAQAISLTALGSAYTQNFDTLAYSAGSTTNSLAIAGWSLIEGGGSSTRDNELYAVDTGSSATGDTYSYGAFGASERALGLLRSSSLSPAVGAVYRNDTGAAITSLEVSYIGEQWRLGVTGRIDTDRIDFQYSTDVTSSGGTWTDVNALDFTTPNTTLSAGARIGNDAANRTAVSSTISGLSIPNGATFWIRWTDWDISGSDDGLAIDDFSLTPSASYTVTFDLVGGTRIGGGELTQTIAHGQAATAPTFTPPAGGTFTGWSADFSNVTGDLTVTARYLGPPNVTGVSPTNNTRPTWTWTPGGGGNGTYRRKLDGGTWITTTATSFRPGPASPLAPGSHVLEVQERDNAGNWSLSGSFTIELVADLAAPGAPTGLSAAYSGGVHLTWTDNAGGPNHELGYWIYRKKTTDILWTRIDAIAPDSQSYTDSASPADQTLLYLVKAWNGAGSTASDATKVMTGSLEAPDQLMTTVTGTGVAITWKDNSTMEDGFDVYRRKNGESIWTSLTGTAPVAPNGRTYSDITGEPRILYAYQVCAMTLDGASACSAIAKASGPTDLLASYETGTGVVLAWNDNADDEAGFRVYRKKSTETSYAKIADLSADAVEFTDTSVMLDNIYTYYVVAYNSAITGRSNTARVTTGSLTAPDRIRAGALVSQVSLTWRDRATTESGYEVWRRSAEAREWAKIVTLDPNTQAYTDTTSTANILYRYQICAITAEGGEACGTIGVNGPTLDPVTYNAGTGAGLQWTDNSSDETSFRILRKAAGLETVWVRIADMAEDATSWTDGTIGDPNYSYKVCAVNAVVANCSAVGTPDVP